MKRYLSKFIVIALILNFLALPASVFAAPSFSYSRFTVAQGWANGSNEYWRIVPVGEKKEFLVGEKVQFFAQIGPINYNHQWRLVLYRDNSQYRVETNTRFYPNAYQGWRYSNFVPYMNNLPVGSYRAEYQLETGNGFEKLSSVNFSVSSHDTYNLTRAVTATGWQYGASDYWNIQPVGQKTSFVQGDTVYFVSQIKNIKVAHRYKVELYKINGQQTKVFENITPWNNVGGGWNFSNYQPYYSNAQVGKYEFRLFIDSGYGWSKLATKQFTVGNPSSEPYRPFIFDRTSVSRDWRYGTGSEYWNLRPVDARTIFDQGNNIIAIAVAKNIVVDYQWKAELYRDGKLVWQESTPWRDVGMGHAYGSYHPEYRNAQSGNYEWKIYLNTGSGFKLVDTEKFSVKSQPVVCDYTNYYCNYDCRYYNNCNYDNRGNWTYGGATVAASWAYGSNGKDLRNILPITPRTTFSRGERVYVVAKATDVRVNHRWSVQAYQNNGLKWTYTTPWNDVRSTTWPYSSVLTSNYDSEPGNYEFRIFFDDGTGMRQIDTKSFYVNY